MRALRTGAARPTLPARDWEAVSCYADPVGARVMAVWVMDTAVWQWAPVPESFSRAVLDSGALHHIRRVVELGAAHAGRYAGPGRLWRHSHSAVLRALLCNVCHSTCSAHPTLTRRCCRRVPAVELNTELVAYGASPGDARAANQP